MSNIPEKYYLKTEQDDVIRGAWEGHSCWIARLDNDLTIYQDDFREYHFEDEKRYSTWARLRSYCYENGVSITNLIIRFRTNQQVIQNNSKGFYFCKSILGTPSSLDNWHFFVVSGQIFETTKPDSVILQCSRWKIPEIIETETEDREVKKDDICLILNQDLR